MCWKTFIAKWRRKNCSILMKAAASYDLPSDEDHILTLKAKNKNMRRYKILPNSIQALYI